MIRLIIFLLATALLCCKSADDQKERFMNWAQKGKITDNVICKNDQSLSYTLYLPSKYNLKRTWPVIFCFDPKGDGKLPVTLLKEAAEKYGYILVGSNNSRNGLGPDEIGIVVNELMADAKLKINIDLNRLYAAGFSGGARVAYSMAMTFGTFKGVITCSAGFNPQQGLSCDVIGIAGDRDMNYLEVKKTDEILENLTAQHQLLVFNGTHHWPNNKLLEKAVTLLQLYSMKEQRIEKNDTVVKSFILSNLSDVYRLESCNNTDSSAIAFDKLNCIIHAADGLAKIDTLKQHISELAKRTDLKEYFNKERMIEENESALQEKYQQAYTSKPLSWWRSEIEELQKKAENKSQILESNSSYRLLAYISLMSYSYVNSAIAQRRWDVASDFLTIYGLADPKNPDYYYFLACAQANAGNTDKAINSLKQAVGFGFKDINKLQNDPLIQNLRNKPEFTALMEEVRR